MAKNKQTLSKTATVTNTSFNYVEPIPQYIIEYKNVFLEMLRRIEVTTVNGRTIAASTHVKDLIQKLTVGTVNVLQHLSQYHPLLWVTHALGAWEEDCYICNPVTTLKKIQDSWFETCRTRGIYRCGSGMGDYQWDEFLKNWNRIQSLKNSKDMSHVDVINWLRHEHEVAREEAERIKAEEKAKYEEQVRKAQEEGERRKKKEEEEKARKEAEEKARREREAKAKEEEETRKKAAEEAKKREEEAEFERMLAEEAEDKRKKEIAQKRRDNINKGRQKKLEAIAAEKSKASSIEDESDDLFVENAASPELDSELFNDSGSVDFLKPIYRYPNGQEVRLHSDDGQFMFGEKVSKHIIDKGFSRMHIEVVEKSFYFTFDNNGGVTINESNGHILVNRKAGVDQMISRLGFDGEDCVFVSLSTNKSAIANKVAFLIEKVESC